MDFLINLLILLLVGYILGSERASHNLIGIRTTSLILLGSFIFTYISTKVGGDPSRIIAQVVSGIGFLGVGTILVVGKSHIRGLTTAAGLLAVTCIGLIVGAGFYIPAIIATFVVYCVLSYSHIISTNLEHYYFIDLKITSNMPKEILEDIRKIFNKEKLEIMKIKIVDDDGEDYIKAEVKYREKVDVNGIVSKIMAIESVKEVVETKSAE